MIIWKTTFQLQTYTPKIYFLFSNVFANITYGPHYTNICGIITLYKRYIYSRKTKHISRVLTILVFRQEIWSGCQLPISVVSSNTVKVRTTYRFSSRLRRCLPPSSNTDD